MIIRIKERSLIAKVAATFLREQRIAIVIGSTIYLWKATKEDLIKNKKWLQHELVHIQQFKKYGFVRFIFLYLLESIKKGYRKNKFEIEARMKEDKNILPHLIHLN